MLRTIGTSRSWIILLPWTPSTSINTISYSLTSTSSCTWRILVPGEHFFTSIIPCRDALMKCEEAVSPIQMSSPRFASLTSLICVVIASRVIPRHWTFLRGVPSRFWPCTWRTRRFELPNLSMRLRLVTSRFFPSLLRLLALRSQVLDLIALPTHLDLLQAIWLYVALLADTVAHDVSLAFHVGSATFA